ncbi:MAG: SUMF1/EgtB/PvdO family nonheme iron enzyme [Marinifilaceae bacterium]|nr:SUMF1/EgtB/PvdO family nonheme iron enzyme [Marinifilaceae bacterium]
MHLRIGSALQGGKYRVEQVLGQGGFGITYLAIQIGLNRKVAIKEFFMKDICNRDASTSHVSVPSVGSKELVEKFKKKFIKEAQTIAELDNNHIIRIHDIFEENGTAYYVMEYLGGGSLSTKIPDGGVPESQALIYIRQLCDALAYIHSKKILHLDIKPTNVLFRESGDLVLIDFGISKHYDDANGGQTSSTPVGISDGYAPTEQYEREGVSTFSASTDIYALGATLYCLLQGVKPPKASIVLNDGLPALPAKVSESTRNAIEHAMQPRRKDRPQNIDEFLKLLDAGGDEIVADSDVTMIELPKDGKIVKGKDESASLDRSVASSVASENGSKGGGTKKWLFGILGAVMAVVLTVVFWPDGGNDVDPEPPTPNIVIPVDVEDVPESSTSQVVVEQNTKLYVESNPSGATVYVDGKSIGTTPISGEEFPVGGNHKIELRKEGYETYSLNETFVAGSVRISKNLDELKTKLNVSTTPAGAYVLLDGVLIGTTPLKNVAVSRGRHDVLLKMDGYKDFSSSYTFSSDPININKVLSAAPVKPDTIILYQNEAGKITRSDDVTPSSVATETINGLQVKWGSDVTSTQKEVLRVLIRNMVSVSGGTFMMGANPGDSDAFDWEKPRHSVTLSGYRIGKYEVTQREWLAVMGSNPSSSKGDNLPVEKVSWNDCQAFIQKLNNMTALSFRLPTEAEWEFAARGGNRSIGYKYSGGDNIGSVAWYTGNSRNTTHPVGQKQGNELGLYDMSGNVCEYCSDWYGRYTSLSQTNPHGPSSGSARVRRGGSWVNDARGCRVSYSDNYTPSSTDCHLGLRLAL